MPHRWRGARAWRRAPTVPGMVVERDWVQDSRSPGIQEALARRASQMQRHRFAELAPDGCPYVTGRSIQWRIHMSDIATSPAVAGSLQSASLDDRAPAGTEGSPDRLPGPCGC